VHPALERYHPFDGDGMHYGVVGADDRLSHYVEVPLPGPRLPHDMAFTENYAILNDCPMFWDPPPRTTVTSSR
jgi:carotenoid cleavage dioxygenase-like enzyme